jgi:small subunit ribosomal protein S10
MNSNEILKLRLESYDCNLLEDFLLNLNNNLELNLVRLPTKIKKFTVLSSPHVNKQSREQFEIRTHKRLIIIKNQDKKFVYNFIKHELPSGISGCLIDESKK